ncbi:hypothetical protein CKO28_14730 [Rhodovibrio sodomensis]|uniref:Restriction endonuclease n=1 Tax=Rhodovibrio sodomensis TaxID=1088 RepID=A0ABS1DIS9_9PROT|nr:hypothetical protein [Rhodovibrio sodomensis]MBK1669290.1 hypothetical protein [Rhodovibrio sodomensis]
METTERIVEAYVRYVKGWATIPNVRCDGQNEIDLLAIDPVSNARHHIEVSISISQSFRKLTGKPYDREAAKQRVDKAKQRRTVGFFVEQKFEAPTVVAKLREFGFEPGAYNKVIVTWGWDADAEEQAQAAGILLWDFRELISEIGDAIRGQRTYFADDTLRTLNLFIHAGGDQRPPVGTEVEPKPSNTCGSAPSERTLWVYQNWTRDKAVVHVGSCPYCNEGRGMHAGAGDQNGEWLGPYQDVAAAWVAAENTKRRDVRRCGHCSPTD